MQCERRLSGFAPLRHFLLPMSIFTGKQIKAVEKLLDPHVYLHQCCTCMKKPIWSLHSQRAVAVSLSLLPLVLIKEPHKVTLPEGELQLNIKM